MWIPCPDEAQRFFCLSIMTCDNCNYSTSNKKSWSNHIRYGCKNGVIILSEKKCKNCFEKIPKRKPSELGIFCNRKCYFEWKNKNNNLFRGENSHLFKTGESKTRLYRIWSGMIRRCKDHKFKDFHNYGGRGITVCDEWMNIFSVFKEWAINNGYVDTLTIERKDVNGNYEPKNCSWIPMSEQSKNRRNVKKRDNF